MEDLIISENIEVIVFGNCNDKFIEKIILNSGFRSGSMIDPLIKQNKEFLSLFLDPNANLNSPSHQNQTTSSVTPAQQMNIVKPEVSQQNQLNVQSKTKNRKKNYFKNVNKLLNFPQIDDDSENNKRTKQENSQILELEKGITFLSWADFRRVTSTISTKNFWINVNFNLVSDMFLDPYINNFVSANINLLVLTFDLEDETQRNKAVDLYKKLATCKPPSSIKYQSQMLLLQSGYYQAFNDNIVLALCELPEIEPIGPCCLVGFGKNDQEMKKLSFEDDKSLSKYISLDLDPVNGCVQFYEWLLQTHQQIKYSNKFDDEYMIEIIKAVRNDFWKKSNERSRCIIF